MVWYILALYKELSQWRRIEWVIKEEIELRETFAWKLELEERADLLDRLTEK